MFDNDGGRPYPSFSLSHGRLGEPFLWIRLHVTVVSWNTWTQGSITARSELLSPRRTWLTVRPMLIDSNFLTEPPFLVLPQGDGNLPIWQVIVATTALFNTVQNFLTLQLTNRLYDNVPKTQPGTSPTFCGLHFSA
jgi:Erg28 like protein